MADKEKPLVPKTATDLQKMKIEKLMKNPDKPVVIPEGPKEKKSLSVPEFVRNVMGSSAGAGSGEFHVYRHLRRKEYSRQKIIDEMAHRDNLDKEFQDRIKENKRLMEERTAKKRAKRLKKKEQLKLKRRAKKGKPENEDNKLESRNKEDDSSSGLENENEEKSSASEKSDSELKSAS